MDIRKRLLRRPLTTVLWQIVLISMALLIGLSGTMVYSSNQLTTIMDQHHTTVAVQNYHEAANENGFLEPAVFLSQRDIDLLEGMEMVEKVDMRTLTGACIPELTAELALVPRGDLHPMNADYMAGRQINDSYNQVAVVGTVEQSWVIQDPDAVHEDWSALGIEGIQNVVCHYAILNVEELLAFHRDFDVLPTEEWESYDGRVFVRMLVTGNTEECWFQEGQRYIVSGAYDPSAHGYATNVSHVPEGVMLPWIEGSNYTTGNASNFQDDGDRLVCYQEVEKRLDLYSRIETIVSVGDPVCGAQRLEGTTEEFLAANPVWQEQVEKLRMAQHTFPVLGTEALESMQYFVVGDAAISEGRMFTREEYDAGAKVCVISESVANASGISVGDKLTFSQYLVAETYEEGNPSLPNDVYSEEANEPAVGTRVIPYGLVTEDEEFTVVGIYRLSRSWQDTAFAFTPNTVFIPQKAQIEGGFGGPSRTEQETNWVIRYSGLEMTADNVTWQGWETQDVMRPRGCYGVFMSVKLKNGTMEEFLAAVEDSWLGDHQFLTFDQGYGQARQSILAVMASARRLFTLAASGWALLLMVYVLLNQSREKRSLGIMRSVGAKVSQTRRYLFAGGFLPAVVGVTIGTALTGTVAALVQDRLIGLVLTTSSGGMIQGGDALAQMLAQSRITPVGLLILAAGQIAVIAAVLWLHSALLSRKNARKLLGV